MEINFYDVIGCKNKEEERILTCINEENREQFILKDTRSFSFDRNKGYLKSYIQQLSMDYGIIGTIDDKRYMDFNNLCNEVKELSGVSCNINKNKESKYFTVELRVTLKELEEDSSIFSENLKNKYISYDTVRKKFINFETNWS